MLTCCHVLRRNNWLILKAEGVLWDFFFIDPKYSAEKSCPLAVIEQNFSKYVSEMFIFW